MSTVLTPHNTNTELRETLNARPVRLSSFWLPFGISFLVLAFGLILLVTSFFSIRDGLASTSWNHAPGTVLSSKAAKSFRTDNQDREIDTWSPNITYQYTVGDKTYTSQRIAFYDMTSDHESAAEQFVHKYQAGSDIQVFYAPDEPSKSVLLPGYSSSAFIGVGVGLLFTILGLGLTLVVVKYILGRRAQARTVLAH